MSLKPMLKMIKIFIADDHILIREGLKKILSLEKDIQIIGETDNSEDIISLVLKTKPDIILLDISFPGKNGLEILKELKISSPDVKALILSMHPEDKFAVRAIKSGAYGYITKESASDELIKAIRKAASGGKYISQNLAEALLNEINSPEKKKPHELLSDREFEVLRLIVSGKSQSEISQKLSLSSSSVNTYRARILKKLNLRTNADLIYYAIQNGLSQL